MVSPLSASFLLAWLYFITRTCGFQDVFRISCEFVDLNKVRR
ncbi:MAG: hypothetical protein [Chaetfec virus UA24_244]|nr:MAG: hypothetical protein [Chaetfec virus UA24_244]